MYEDLRTAHRQETIVLERFFATLRQLREALEVTQYLLKRLADEPALASYIKAHTTQDEQERLASLGAWVDESLGKVHTDFADLCGYLSVEERVPLRYHE